MRDARTLVALDPLLLPISVRCRMLNSISTSPPSGVSCSMFMMESTSCPPATSRFPSGDWLTARNISCEICERRFCRKADPEYTPRALQSPASSNVSSPPRGGITFLSDSVGAKTGDPEMLLSSAPIDLPRRPRDGIGLGALGAKDVGVTPLGGTPIDDSVPRPDAWLLLPLAGILSLLLGNDGSDACTESLPWRWFTLSSQSDEVRASRLDVSVSRENI